MAALADVKTIALSAAVVVVGVLAWKASKLVGQGADVAKKLATETLNPASDKNIVNSGVTALGQAATGDPAWTLGGWFASVTGADRDAEIAAMLKGTTAPYDETERLARRYPAPYVPTAQYDPMTGAYLGEF
jgi:hypothetical protein